MKRIVHFPEWVSSGMCLHCLCVNNSVKLATGVCPRHFEEFRPNCFCSSTSHVVCASGDVHVCKNNGPFLVNCGIVCWDSASQSSRQMLVPLLHGAQKLEIHGCNAPVTY